MPLSQLADIRIRDGASIIVRREKQRALTVRTNIRDQGGFVAEAQAKFAQAVRLPPGYRVNWGGYFENLERARLRLSLVILLTIAIIFILLFITFGSALDSVLVLLNVPFSMAGGLIPLYRRGIRLSVPAAVGFISLFGVAVLSGLLYISEINGRRRIPGTALVDAVVLGGPGPLSASADPYSRGDPRDAAARTCAGYRVRYSGPTGYRGGRRGLVSTLLLTLLALPAVHMLVERFRRA